MKLSPIVLFTYKRLQTLKQTVEALKANALAMHSDLYVYSDGAKSFNDEISIAEVREYLKTISGFNTITIHESPINKGLASSIIDGVTEVINQRSKVIVLEDDLIVSQNFLAFMNEALDFYENNNKVFSVSGYGLKVAIPKNYNYDVYLTPRGMSWGWASWKDRWENVDWEVKDYADFKISKTRKREFATGGTDLCEMLQKQMEQKIDSWAIRWTYNQYKNKQLTVFPVLSKVLNIGFDAYATHTNAFNRFDTLFDKSNQQKYTFEPNAITNSEIFISFQSYFGYFQRIFYGRLVSPLYKLWRSVLTFFRLNNND